MRGATATTRQGGGREERRDRFERAIEYEEPMLRMKEHALRAAALYKLSHYSGICGLTWATVVLLGGFASSLAKADFCLISFALLLQALQFAASATFRRLLSAHLFRESHHPNEFTLEDERHVAYMAEIGRKLGRPEKLAEAAADTLEILAEKWVDHVALPPVHAVEKAHARARRRFRGRRQLDPHELIVTNGGGEGREGREGGGGGGRGGGGGGGGGSRSPRPRRHPFLEAKLRRDTTIVDELVDLVVRPRRASLVFQLRALESCCRSDEVVAWIRQESRQRRRRYRELLNKLLGIVAGPGPAPAATRAHPRPKQRTKIYAASVAFSLLRSVPIEDDDHAHAGKDAPAVAVEDAADAAPFHDARVRNASVDEDAGAGAAGFEDAGAAGFEDAGAAGFEVADPDEFRDAAAKRLLRSLLRSGAVHPADGSEAYVWRKEVILLDTVLRELRLPPYDWGESLIVRDPEQIIVRNIAPRGLSSSH